VGLQRACTGGTSREGGPSKKIFQKKTDLPTRKETSQKDVFARNFASLEPALTEGASTHLKTDVYIRKETDKKDVCTNNVSTSRVSLREASMGGESRVSGPSTAVVP